MTDIKVGDKFSDRTLVGSPAVVVAVGPGGEWIEMRWMQGAPAYRYGLGYIQRRLVKVN